MSGFANYTWTVKRLTEQRAWETQNARMHHSLLFNSAMLEYEWLHKRGKGTNASFDLTVWTYGTISNNLANILASREIEYSRDEVRLSVNLEVSITLAYLTQKSQSTCSCIPIGNSMIPFQNMPQVCWKMWTFAADFRQTMRNVYSNTALFYFFFVKKVKPNVWLTLRSICISRSNVF